LTDKATLGDGPAWTEVNDSSEIAWTSTPTVSGTGAGTVFPATKTFSVGPITATAGTVYPASKPKPSKVLEMPTRQPKKILIAFLDHEDNVEWSAKVHPGDVNIRFGDHGIPEMDLSVHLTEAD
jgi:hypothetical protein